MQMNMEILNTVTKIKWITSSLSMSKGSKKNEENSNTPSDLLHLSKQTSPVVIFPARSHTAAH